MDSNTPITIMLTAAQWDIVGAGLYELPAKICMPIFQAIRAQVQAAAEPAPPASDHAPATTDPATTDQASA